MNGASYASWMSAGELPDRDDDDDLGSRPLTDAELAHEEIRAQVERRRHIASRYMARRLAGRCADGAERDGGRRFHAVEVGKWSAVCGARPGRRSAGWSSHVGGTITCPSCLKQLGVTEAVVALKGAPILCTACADERHEHCNGRCDWVPGACECRCHGV